MPTVWYEVRATVRDDVRSRFESYMRDKHIRDVLATGAFERAFFERAGPGEFRTRYEAASREKLEQYLDAHASRLRADVQVHFPEGVEYHREEWTAVAKFRPGSGHHSR